MKKPSKIYEKGDVVVLPFPFSDLTTLKKRPAVVLAPYGSDVILCSVSSKLRADFHSIPLTEIDFEKGGLNLTSVAKPNRLFTADKSLVLYKVGRLKKSKLKEIKEELIKIINN